MAEVTTTNPVVDGQQNSENSTEGTEVVVTTESNTEVQETHSNNPKKVTNPLTMISIFAGFAEVAGTVILIQLQESYQGIFIWFVMGFPILLVLLFFATMNFNSLAMYAPSDYKDEANYLKLAKDSMTYDKKINDLKDELRKRDEIIHIIEEQLEEALNPSEVLGENPIRLNQDMDIGKVLIQDKLSQLKNTDDMIRDIRENAIDMSQWSNKTKKQLKAQLNH